MKETIGRLGGVVERITAPFGARSLTPAQIAAQAEMQAPQQPTNVRAEKWRVLHDLTTARARLGLTAATLTVLEAMLTFLPEAVLAPDREAGVELVVFPSNRTLSARARGLSEAALRRHIAALAEAGLVIRRDSPNGKRYVRRGEGGQVTQAFGFDLTPLALRAGEFAALADAVRADDLAQRIAREKVTLLRRDCAKLLDALDAGEANEPGVDSQAGGLRQQYLALVSTYPRRPEPTAVSSFGDALEALALAVSTALIARAESNKISGSAAQSERHLQSSNSEAPVCEKASGDGGKPTRAPASAALREAVPDSAIRSTYPLTSVLEACPQLLDHSPSGIRTWNDLIETANRIRPMLGISPTAWDEAQATMGMDTAAITLAAILERHEHIKSHGGYLRTLTERKRAGNYSLGPVLQALRRGRLKPGMAAGH